ncbi:MULTISPECIES: PEP-CTERM sorting domain-containing protein [Psychromonas]|uniref:PEP-CTERM sorting domain-containing protein n=1 Tax=Psychromonas TaxID=67572 RepID=UPI0004026969|nr:MULTISPECIES: PEP-CTERM sorting domain-containing protein [Psychromonas]MBB1273468.1 PEP-CTERM sorting domain-containing protein [Psychromonas sp. SR45-3]
MNRIASMFVLLFASITANAGILLDSGDPFYDSGKCVAQGCNGTGEWWAVSAFTASTDWTITGFNFFAVDTKSVGNANYQSTTWKIFEAPSTTGIANLGTATYEATIQASTSQSLFTDAFGGTINVTSFLISNLDIELSAGNYFLAQHHDFSQATNLTIAGTGNISSFYNTDFAGITNKVNDQIAQKIFGKVSIPEPALIALFGIGLVGLGWSRKKRA